MRLVIITGMSGAGKSSVLKMLEDAGYFCVDNLPIPLIIKMTRLTFEESKNIEKAALGIDIRSGQALEELEAVLSRLDLMGYRPEILFLESSTDVLVKRYKETRRKHPLSQTGLPSEGIELERERLDFLKIRADYIIDSSRLLIRELKSEIYKIFVSGEEYHNFYITVLSFGFKYAIPTDADLVFDVRFLPNPYYIPELKHRTGKDTQVAEFVLKNGAGMDFMDRLEDMLRFLIPHYIEEGKNQLIVAIGCTGGKHRSVTMACMLGERLAEMEYGWKVQHRDMEKE